MINPAMPRTAPAITPDQQFEVIYRDHSRQITTFIASRLYRTDRYLAEDLTSETFLRLWRSLNAGLQVERPRALLTTIAERTIADHFRRRRAWESATDFTAPQYAQLASPVVPPHLAQLLAELEDAKEHLALAADAYRAVTRQYALACAAVATAVTAETIARAELRRDRTRLLRGIALSEFAAAGRAVARARAEWNGTAGDLAAEPLPQRNPGETFRKTPATVGAPKPVGGAK